MNHATILTLFPEKIVAKGRPRFTKAGITYTPVATKNAEKYIIEEWKSRIDPFLRDYPETLEAPIRVDISFGFPAPKSDKKRAGKAMTQKPDVDNLGKLVLDALNGLAWKDDSQIVDLRLRKQPWREHSHGNFVYIQITYLLDKQEEDDG